MTAKSAERNSKVIDFARVVNSEILMNDEQSAGIMNKKSNA